MPVLSGHDAYSQMCAIRPDLVVIFATGYTVELTPNHTLEEGAVFLQKPYSSQTIARAMRSTLDSAHRS
jgi:FixJ family two-component response regulator